MKFLTTFALAAAALASGHASAACVGSWEAYQYGQNNGRAWAEQKQWDFANELTTLPPTYHQQMVSSVAQVNQLCDIGTVINCKAGLAAGAGSVYGQSIQGIWIPGGGELAQRYFGDWQSFQQSTCRPF